MKKLSKLLALAAGLASLFVVGCSDISDESGTVSSSVNDITSNKKDYSISLIGADGTPLDLSTFGVNSEESLDRAIVATNQDLSSYKFYLWGTDIVDNNSSISPKKVTFTPSGTDGTTGSVTLDLKVSNYKLVLAAVKEDLGDESDYTKITPKALYIGYANVDLRNTSSIKFYINSDGLQETGKVAIKVVYDGLDAGGGTWTTEHKTKVSSNANYSIYAKILNRATGAVVVGGTIESEQISLSNTTFFDVGADFGTSASPTEVNPGTYNFVVYFKDKVNANKVYTYSDMIIVLPNQTINATVKVPDVIEYVPSAPTDLKVGYVTPATADIGTYNAVLTWTDASKNESYFEVEIVDLSESTSYPNAAVTDDDKWSAALGGVTASKKVTYGKDFYGNSTAGWVAGSLQRNNNHIVVKLSLGTPYIMRVSAVNDAGRSETYAYATYDLSETWTDGDVYHAGAYAAKPFALKELDFATTSHYAFTGSGTSFTATDDTKVELYKAKTAGASAPTVTYTPVTVERSDSSAENYYTTLLANGTTYYLENDGTDTVWDSTNDSSANPTTVYTKTITPGTGGSTGCGIVANLYRLTYNMNGGTLRIKASGADSFLETKNPVVCYLTQDASAGIPILEPYYPTNAIFANQDFPSLVKENNAWTSWRKEVVEGDNYDASNPVTLNGVTHYKPGAYKDFKNLDLYASYSVASAAVEGYLDRMYNFIDDEVAITIASVGTKVNSHSYVVYNGTDAITLTYTFNSALKVDLNADDDTEDAGESITRTAFTYSSLFATIQATSDTTASGSGSGRVDFTSGSCSLNIGNLPGNKKYRITVIGEYKGHQYSYPIIIDLQDKPTAP